MGFILSLFGLSSGSSIFRLGIGIGVALLIGLSIGGTLGYRYASGRAAVAESERLKAESLERERLTKEKQEAEEAGRNAIAVVTAHYEDKLRHAKTQRDKDITAAYSGALSLRIPTASAEKYLPSTRPSSGQCDGQARGELPRSVTAGLYAIANDCNAIVDQLIAAQGVIEAQQKVCGR